VIDDDDGVRVPPRHFRAVIQAPPAQEIDRQAMPPGGGERPVEARVGRIGNLLLPQHQPDPHDLRRGGSSAAPCRKQRAFRPRGNVLMWRAFGKGSWDAKARKPGNMITAAQCRSARTLLGWSLNKLSSVASVPERVIDDFEVERRCPNAAALDAIRRAFEDVGVVFVRDNDVRMRAETPIAE